MSLNYVKQNEVSCIAFIFYCGTIRAGPLRHINMMKYDAKHRIFKKVRHATNNFVSINKTLAKECQKLACLNGFELNDDIKHGVWRPVNDDSILNLLPGEEMSIFEENILETKYFHFNNYKYSRGIMIVYQSSFLKISHIIRISNISYFICKPYEIKKFYSFLNSFEVNSINSNDLVVVKFSDLLQFGIEGLSWNLIYVK